MKDDTSSLEKVPSWEDLANSFYSHIAHGDEEHRAWLKKETFKWFKARSKLFQDPK